VNQNQQRQFDAQRRVQHLLDSRAGDVEVLKACEGRKELDDAVEQSAASSNEKGTAIRQLDGLLSRQKTLVWELRYRYMEPIATFARARLHGATDVAALTRSTLRLRPKPLVHAAQAMATAAAPHADVLAKGGFPDCIDRLNTAADELTAVMEDRANTRIAKMRATKALDEQVQRGRKAVSMLHAVVSNLLGDDATFMTGWNAARRVGRKVGAVHGPRTTTATPAAAEQTALAPEASAA
jgi:hypothetical protein